MMRLNLLIASVATAVLLLTVAAYILIMAIKHGGVTEWTGIGVFVGMLLGGLTGLSFAKSQQKRFENNVKVPQREDT